MIRKALVLALMVVGAIALAPQAGAQYQPGQPGVILSPSTVTPGATVLASGFGCVKGIAVEILIDGNIVATGVASMDEQGSFSVPFTAPTAPNQYSVVARCGTTEVMSVLSVVAAATTVVAQAADLPATGGESMPTVKLALALVAVGGLLVLAVRRRREA